MKDIVAKLLQNSMDCKSKRCTYGYRRRFIDHHQVFVLVYNFNCVRGHGYFVPAHTFSQQKVVVNYITGSIPYYQRKFLRLEGIDNDKVVRSEKIERRWIKVLKGLKWKAPIHSHHTEFTGVTLNENSSGVCFSRYNKHQMGASAN